MILAARQDLRSALRSLGRNRISSLLIIAMLGLGIAGNAVAFSWIDALLLRPLPFDEAERLVDLDAAIPEWQLESAAVHYTDFDGWRRHQTTFEAMAVLRGQDFNLSGVDWPEHVKGARVSHDLLDVLRLQPVIGRWFEAAEDRPGETHLVLLGHGLWQRRFGGREDVLQQSIRLDGEPYTIIGVMPPEAAFPLAADLWVALRADPARWQGYNLTSIARLRDGVEPATAQADLETIQQGRRAAGKLQHEVIPVVRSLHERYLGAAKPYVLALWILVGCVLAIACFNIACLLFIHALTRLREFGVRSSLGASRFMMLRHVFVECLLLAALGGALGWVLATAGLRLLMASIGDGIPFWARPELDSRVLLLCAMLSLGVALLAGIAPYLPITGKPVRELLGSAAASPGRKSQRLMRTLVGGEIAIAVALLFGTGLLLRSFFELRQVDPGFRTENLLTFELQLPPSSDRQSAVRFYEALQQGLAGLPGVLSASSVSALPLSGPAGAVLVTESSDRPAVEGEQSVAPRAGEAVSLFRVVAPGYFDTMGIPLSRGRAFDAQDGQSSGARVVIVNESFARRFWPEQDAIGQRLKRRGHRSPDAWMTVIGVARDVLHDGLDRPSRPGVYVPLAQQPQGRLTVVLHGPNDPLGLSEPVRQLVRELDPGLPIFHFQTMRSRLDESLSALRVVAELATIFMGIALILALGGIYGAVSYAANQRLRELAIRMAVGARPSQVQQLVLSSGARLIAIGTVFGAVLSVGLLRVLQAVLYGVESSGLQVLGVSVASLMAVALLAAFVPAWKFSRAELVRALHP
ncbi:MAG: ABC transporter permease [Acidobacteriota bacterium]